MLQAMFQILPNCCCKKRNKITSYTIIHTQIIETFAKNKRSLNNFHRIKNSTLRFVRLVLITKEEIIENKPAKQNSQRSKKLKT